MWIWGRTATLIPRRLGKLAGWMKGGMEMGLRRRERLHVITLFFTFAYLSGYFISYGDSNSDSFGFICRGIRDLRALVRTLPHHRHGHRARARFSL